MSKKTFDFTTDCLVIGGGPAGYGAAMAALAGGVSVLLVERHGFMGGMGSAAGLGCFINYHYRGEDLSDSVYRQLTDRMKNEGTCYHGDGEHVDLFDPEALKRTMETNMLGQGGRLLYHCVLRSLDRVDGEWVAEFSAKGSSVVVKARYVVDSTGDADACAMAGAQMTHGRRSDGKTQPMTMVVQMGGFDPASWAWAGGTLVDGLYAGAGDCYAAEICAARAAGEWDIPRENISMVWGMAGDPTRILVNGTRVQGLNASDPLDFTRAEIEGRRQAVQLVAFFKKYIPGFKKAFLLSSGPQIGVRETRRIIGRETLTEQHVLQSRMPTDAITRCAYPIDVHNPEGNSTNHEPQKADYLYGISYGCLLPAGLDNILAAGRCISATHEAAGSFRVMPTCMSIGQAAGTAVALASRAGIRLADVSGENIRNVMAAGEPALTA